jgi:hypothetical protein
MFDTAILSIATALAAVGVGGLLVDEVGAARAKGRRSSGDPGWTLLWAVALSAISVAAWTSRR